MGIGVEECHVLDGGRYRVEWVSFLSLVKQLPHGEEKFNKVVICVGLATEEVR